MLLKQSKNSLNFKVARASVCGVWVCGVVVRGGLVYGVYFENSRNELDPIKIH